MIFYAILVHFLTFNDFMPSLDQQNIILHYLLMLWNKTNLHTEVYYINRYIQQI